MQQVNATQANPQRSLRAMLGMTNGGNVSGVPGQMGDGFDMIFQNMLAGGMEGEDNLAAMLMQLTGGLQKDSEKWGAQMAAEMLNSCPTLNPAVMTALVEASWAADGQNLAEAIGRLQQQQGANLAELLAGRDVSSITEAMEELVLGEEQSQGNENQDFLDILSAAWAKPKADTTTLSTQLDHSSIRAAKELMQRDKKEVLTPLLDVESLQADVDSRRFAPVSGNSSIEEQAQVPSGEELADQIKAGIFENVSQGRNEFVVRIKPDGLGEIEVKLSQDENKISLSIVAANDHTARLISGDILALQNALRPLNAEVQQITTMAQAQAVAASEQSTQYSAQNQMTDQGRQSHGQEESSRGGRAQRIGGVAGVEEDFDETVTSGAAATDEILDTYI